MWTLLFTSSIIFIFGLFNLLGIDFDLFKNQLTYFLIGLPVFLLVRKVGIQFLRVNSFILYWVFIGLIILTYIVGAEIKGSKRWIDLYFFSFQTSEFFKVIFMAFLADFYAKNRYVIKDLGFFIKAIAYFLLPTILIFKQPDLGNALVFVAIFIVVTFFSGVPKKNILKIAGLGALLLPFGWLFLKQYQKDRILAFLNPHLDQGGTAYNMIQAIVTVGSGKFLGRGLGNGTQSGLFFLPENHTDFAFSSLVEQFGFIGGAALIILYGIVAFLLIRKILQTSGEKNEDARFKFLFLLGFFAYFITQVFINIGMNLGIMPITGITLPLISYGGSSVLTWLIGIALIQ